MLLSKNTNHGRKSQNGKFRSKWVTFICHCPRAVDYADAVSALPTTTRTREIRTLQSNTFAKTKSETVLFGSYGVQAESFEQKIRVEDLMTLSL